MSTNIVHPWQLGPTELLTYALNHLHNPTDADRRIAFLLLDAGVETTLKTYLQLPNAVIKTQLSYSKRNEASEGNFHQVLEGIKEADSKRESGQTSRLTGIDLTHIEFYHNIRNKLYHQGNGITVSAQRLNEYAEIAVQLLKQLLSVDLEDLLRLPQKRALQQQAIQALKQEIESKKELLQGRIKVLNSQLKLAVEKIDPSFLLPRFEQKCYEWIRKIDTTKDSDDMPEAMRTFIEKHDIEDFAFPFDYYELLLTIAGFVIGFGDNPYHNIEGKYSLANLYVKGQYPPPSLHYDGETEEEHLQRVIRSGEELIEDMNEIINHISRWDRTNEESASTNFY